MKAVTLGLLGAAIQLWAMTSPASCRADGHDVMLTAFKGADPTGATDSIPAFRAALATGRDVHVPKGRWSITKGWIDMTIPGQLLVCDTPGTAITVKRPGRNPSPALIIEPSARGAAVRGCVIDHDGKQFLDTGSFVPLDPMNTTAGSHATDSLGNAVLVMADGASFSGTVVNGWDNCIGLGLFNLRTGAQSLGPLAPVVRNTTTRNCGSGRHHYDPDFYQGAGVDVLTATRAVVADSEDWSSYDGFWVDTSGGGSASFSNLTAHSTRMSRPLFHTPDPWHVTPGGVAFYLSGSTRNYDGSTSAALAGSSCTHCTAIRPGAQGLLVDLHSNGTVISDLRVVDPGLECIWIRAGSHRLDGVVCDGAGAAGHSAVGAGVRVPRVSAIQVDASRTPDASAVFWNTRVQLNHLVVDGSPPAYAYAVALGGYDGQAPDVVLTHASMQAGVLGRSFVSPHAALHDDGQR